MCGIFGILVQPSSTIKPYQLKTLVKKAFYLIERRGKDAFGFFCVFPETIEVVKFQQRAKTLTTQALYTDLINKALHVYEEGYPFILLGHTRLETNGSSLDNKNNQPVIKGDHIILHNGIITNNNELWDVHAHLKKESEVDTEVFGALLDSVQQDYTLIKSVQKAYTHIKGANTTVSLRLTENILTVCTTTGSMYFDAEAQTILFASEKHFVQAMKKFLHKETIQVQQLKAQKGLSIHLDTFLLQQFSIAEPLEQEPVAPVARTVKEHTTQQLQVFDKKIGNDLSEIAKHLKYNSQFVQKMQRCTQCLLPKTFPFIKFNEKGVCQLCQNYKPRELKGEDYLYSYTKQLKNSICLVPLSGGRDSCYGLHYIKKELGLNPIAFTYDWGFVTDLARKNISRLCGALGVEHIIIDPDIQKKRSYVRKNVIAWLKRPSLGMIPLFMAGDKMFFYYASQLRKELGAKKIIFSMNWLEKTDFKSGFAQVNCLTNRGNSTNNKTYSLTLRNIIDLCSYYGSQFLLNPAYINSSMLDTLLGFFAFYMRPKDYISLFDYLPWKEHHIEDTIINNYGWELAKDSVSTWRIGDGISPFYNYIYYTVAGFSEYDTFRSNQIREGLITREKGLALLLKESKPRPEGFKWFCDVININALDTIKAINAIPKLYDPELYA